MLERFINALHLPRRYLRTSVFVALVVVVVLVSLEQRALFRSTPERAAAGRHDASVPQGGVLKEEDDESVRPELEVTGRVLVTGGAGMIGKQVVSRLLSAGIAVTVLDITHHRDELEAMASQYPHADLEFIQGDIRDDAELNLAVSGGVIGTIHLAGYSRIQYCAENEEDCWDVNVRGTRKLMNALNGGWVIYPSSSQVYGDPVSRGLPVSEDAELKAVNFYGSTKIQAEEAVRHRVQEKAALAEGMRMNAAILRVSTVYGSAADHQEDFVVDFMEKAIAHRPVQVLGNSETNLIHIRDVVNAIMVTVTHLNTRTYGTEREGVIDIINIGTTQTISALDFVRRVMWLTNSSSPLQMLDADPHVPKWYSADVRRALVVLGWEAEIGLEEGLHRLAKVYLTDTIAYLKRKEQHECGALRQSYSLNDVLKLDGCSGTLAVDIDGQPFYAYYDPDMPDDPANGKKASQATYGWRDENAPQAWNFDIRKKGKTANLILRRYLPEKKDQKGHLTEAGQWIEFEGVDPLHPGRHDIEFRTHVDPKTGYLSLNFMDGPPVTPWKPQPPPGRRRAIPNPSDTALGEFRFRLTPFCCPDRAAPWPFFRDDPLSSNVLDYHQEKTREFNASQINMLCKRLGEARGLAEMRLEKISKVPPPFNLDMVPMPTGRPYDWKSRGRDVCTNLCDHPTLCLDTGHCACGQAACATIRPRFPFTDWANLNMSSYPPNMLYANGGTADDGLQDPEDDRPTVLADRVAKASWLNVLHPYARRYLLSKPHYHAVNLTRIPPEEEEERFKKDPAKFDRVQTEWHGCFSADSVMERGVKLISEEYKKDSLVFLPYYSYTQRFKPVQDWTKYALEHYLPKDVDVADFNIPFTFDWGKCNTILNGLYRIRDWSNVEEVIRRASSWQPMGDLNSQCYDMDQDIVIPARTCRQEDLRKMFSDVRNVKPARDRSTLVFFKGAPNGAGTSVRYKIACDRPYRDIHGALTGGNELERYWNEYRPDTVNMTNEDAYISTIGDTIFCPVPRGTAGWSPRITDTLYAGCIPVLMGDQTHEPFWDMLNWSKFSITVADYDTAGLEQVLLSYSWDEVERLQTNLMLVREAFLYPAEGHMEDNLKGHSPFFFAMHSASLLKRTAFPVK